MQDCLLSSGSLLNRLYAGRSGFVNRLYYGVVYLRDADAERNRQGNRDKAHCAEQGMILTLSNPL